MTTNTVVDLDAIAAAFDRAARALYGQDAPVDVTFEPPRNAEFGDYATNVAFRLAKVARKSPQAIAGEIAQRALADDAALRATVSDATPTAGFINLRMHPAFWQTTVATILAAGGDYGRGAPTGMRRSLELGSAN